MNSSNNLTIEEQIDYIFSNLDLRVDEGQAYLYDDTEAKQQLLSLIQEENRKEYRKGYAAGNGTKNYRKKTDAEWAEMEAYKKGFIDGTIQSIDKLQALKQGEQ